MTTLPHESRPPHRPPSTADRPGPSSLLATVCRTTFDALLVVDDERRYIRVNRPALEMLGAPHDQVLRSRIEDFTPREHHQHLDGLWRRLALDGELSGPYEVLRADGERSAVEFRATWEVASGVHLIAARHAGRRIAVAGEGASPLTAREREVLQLASKGLTIKEIGEELYISAGTVKTHLENVYSKLRARDRASAVAEALRRGIIR